MYLLLIKYKIYDNDKKTLPSENLNIVKREKQQIYLRQKTIKYKKKHLHHFQESGIAEN